MGSIPDHGHEWDDDPAAWVHAQRYPSAPSLTAAEPPSLDYSYLG